MNYAQRTTNSPIDYAQLLDRCDNEQDVARLEINFFVSQVTGLVDELQSAFDQQHYDTVIESATAIQDVADAAVANPVRDAAGEIVAAATAEDFSGAVGLMPELQTQAIRLQEWNENMAASL